MRTLATHADDLDARRYQCPPPLERRIASLLEPDSSVRILTITGRGGAGKSAGLREIGRRAMACGSQVIALDARSEDVVEAVEALRTAAAAVVLVDEADTLGPRLAALGVAIAALPEGSRVVVAGRAIPSRWLPTEVQDLAATMRLAAMTMAESGALLARCGVASASSRATIVRWAGGLPLALVIGARAWEFGDFEDAAELDAGLAATADEDLWSHLTGAVLHELDPDLVGVLAFINGVDRPLLHDLFAGRVDELIESMRACPVVEEAGAHWVLHPILARIVADRMRSDEPVRATATVLRIAAHEQARAMAGEPASVPRLASLVRDPELRIALGDSTGSGHVPDRWRLSDTPVVRDGIARLHPGAWDVIAPWAGAASRVVRRPDGRAVAAAAGLSLAAAAEITGPRAELVEPLVRHAAELGLVDRVVLTAYQLNFGDLDAETVTWTRNAALLRQSGLGNPRIALANLVGESQGERRIMQAWGYQEIPSLARTVGDVPITSWWIDAGKPGVAGMLYAAVLAEHGVADRSATVGGALLAGLEHFHLDGALASLPVAPDGVPVEQAAEHVRAWVQSRIAQTLEEEPALLDLVRRRYLREGATHDSVIAETYLSRATYYRRLRRARELLADR